MTMRISTLGALALSCLTTTLGNVHTAEACGCLSPPIPEADQADFAINQQGEQIIFEVGDGTVTAHVLIRYAGEPEKFAWIVPVPDVPDFALSSAALFGLVGQSTRPRLFANVESMCPASEYTCSYHWPPWCPTEDEGGSHGGAGAGGGEAGAGGYAGGAGGDAFGGEGGQGGVGGPPPVQVHQRETIGSYDTVVLSGESAEAVVSWLTEEGFIVNESMAPYMQPYLEANMLFAASKLVPGADVSEIQPLQMTFPAEHPMIPLQLTAVAAEPHMPITAYIFADRS